MDPSDDAPGNRPANAPFHTSAASLDLAGQVNTGGFEDSLDIFFISETSVTLTGTQVSIVIDGTSESLDGAVQDSTTTGSSIDGFAAFFDPSQDFFRFALEAPSALGPESAIGLGEPLPPSVGSAGDPPLSASLFAAPPLSAAAGANMWPEADWRASWEAASVTGGAGQTSGGSVSAALGSGLTFTLIDTGGVSVGSQAWSGFQMAAALWSSYLIDPVNVRLDVGFSTLGASILGSTGSSSAVVSYAAVRTALTLDATSTIDLTAVANLPLGPSLSFYTNSLGARVYDNDGSANNTYLDVNTANLKALGIATDANGNPIDDGSSADGSITFNSSFTFDFNPSDGVAAGAIDFVGIAFHEIGHALGFVSGVDIVDYYSNINLNPYAVFSTLDLYRYSASGTRDLGYGGTTYFSVNGGATNLGLFSTGEDHGDGRQASHWKDNRGLGIMDPTSVPAGQANVITDLDIQAMDAIGWNRASVASAGSVAINDVWIAEGDTGTKVLNFTVSRAGGTGAFSVNYATANGTAMAGSDYVATSGTLNFGIAENSKAIAVTINGDTAMEANETFLVNLSGATGGAAIGDSQGVGTIVNDDTAPDLAAYLNMGNTTVAVGGSLAIDEYTKNFGGAAGASATAFYLSTDTNINTSDILLTTRSAAALTGYGNGSGSSWYDHQAFSVTLTGIAAGNYYLGALADASGQLSETNEANNNGNTVRITVTSGASATAPADLIASLNMSSKTVAAGGSLAIDEYTKNIGSSSAGASSTAYYLSSDASINTSDMLLSSQSAASLTGYGGGSGTAWYDHQAFSQALSTSIAPGTYFLGAIADGSGQVSETNETNNVSNAVQITVTAPADLIGNLNMGTTHIAPGGTLAIDEYTKNFGNGATAASTTAFYLSTDTTIDTSDMLLASKTAAPLTGYGTGSGTAWYDHQAFSVTLSSGLADGTYYLGASADAGNQIGELSETNNVWNIVQVVVDHSLV